MAPDTNVTCASNMLGSLAQFMSASNQLQLAMKGMYKEASGVQGVREEHEEANRANEKLTRERDKLTRQLEAM